MVMVAHFNNEQILKDSFPVIGPIFVYDAPAIKLKHNQLLLWTYLSNLPIKDLDWNGSDLFRLGHFWSLAVEEHFYLLWPGIILLFYKYIKQICYAWAGASFLAGIYMGLPLEHKWIFLNWTTIHHSGGLALGGLCAIFIQEQSLKADYGNLKHKMFFFFILFVGLSMIPRRIIPRLEIFIYPLSYNQKECK